MEQEKLCTNCKYFLQYYIFNGNKIKKSFYGQCYKLNIKPNQMYRRIVNNSHCENWEQNNDIADEMKNTLTQEIRKLVRLFKDISTILKLDE